MNSFGCVDIQEWGYHPSSPVLCPEGIIAQIKASLLNTELYEINPPPAPEKSEVFQDHLRFHIEIPVSKQLYEHFFHGPCGYLAQYYLSPAQGDAYNQFALEQFVPIMLAKLGSMKNDLWEKTLTGSYTKLWFPKELADGSLPLFAQTIDVSRWSARNKKYLRIPEKTHILLNGTFVHGTTWHEANTKPNRATEIHNQGQT